MRNSKAVRKERDAKNQIFFLQTRLTHRDSNFSIHDVNTRSPSLSSVTKTVKPNALKHTTNHCRVMKAGQTQNVFDIFTVNNTLSDWFKFEKRTRNDISPLPALVPISCKQEHCATKQCSKTWCTCKTLL